MIESHDQTQQRYYTRRHSYLDSVQTPYVNKCVDVLVREGRITQQQRILEIGCGRGRFTVPLIQQGFSLTCLEPSAELAGDLKEQVAESGTRVLVDSLEALSPDEDGLYDRVIGFYVLHHLEDLGRAFDRIRRLLKPSGELVFLEPNPWNLLFALQYTFCRDFSWRAEWRTYIQFPSLLRRRLRTAGFASSRFTNFGFFPPAVYNTAAGTRLEDSLEQFRPLKKFLPYQVVNAGQ